MPQTHRPDVSSAIDNVNSNPRDSVHGVRPSTQRSACYTCPPDAYIKRITCPTRQQFYKELQHREQTNAEIFKKVCYTDSNPSCPRSYEVRFLKVNTCEDRGDKAAKDSDDECYGQCDSARKPCIKFSETSRDRKGFCEYASHWNPTPSFRSNKDQQTQAGVDVICENMCREAKKYSVLDYSKEGLSPHLKYGLFASCNYKKSVDATPAHPPKRGSALNRKLRGHGPSSNMPSRRSNHPWFERNYIKKQQRKLTSSKIMHVDIKPRAQPPILQANSPISFYRNHRNNLARKLKPKRALNLTPRDLMSLPVFPYRYSRDLLRGNCQYYRTSNNRFPTYDSLYISKQPYLQRATSLRNWNMRTTNRCPTNRKSRSQSQRRTSRSASRYQLTEYEQFLTSPYRRTRSSQSPEHSVKEFNTGKGKQDRNHRSVSRVSVSRTSYNGRPQRRTPSEVNNNKWLRSAPSRTPTEGKLQREMPSTYPLPPSVLSTRTSLASQIHQDRLKSDTEQLNRNLNLAKKVKNNKDIVMKSALMVRKTNPAQGLLNNKHVSNLEGVTPNKRSLPVFTKQPQNSNFCTNASTREESLVLKKRTSSSSYVTSSPVRHILSISTQTFITS